MTLSGTEPNVVQITFLLLKNVTHGDVKGNVTLAFKMDIAPDVYCAVYPSLCIQVFGMSCWVSYWYVMKVDDTSLVVLKVPTK